MLINSSLLDIEGTLSSGEEAIKYKFIKKWITDNFKVTDLKLSKNQNSDGKYEVSAASASVTNKNITSLTNDMFVWSKIKNDFYCSGCTSLKSLEGAPKEVGEDFCCFLCYNLSSLKGAPKKVGGDFYCNNCRSLTSLEGAPEIIYKDFNCTDCRSLTSLEGAPKEVGRDFDCSWCESLTSLEGAPKKVGRGFCCYDCTSLKSTDLPSTTKIKGKIYK